MQLQGGDLNLLRVYRENCIIVFRVCFCELALQFGEQDGLFLLLLFVVLGLGCVESELGAKLVLQGI